MDGYYVRQLTIADLNASSAVESAAFPPNEAASRESIEYRLTACPEICFGAFRRAAAGQTSDDLLIAHVLSTNTHNKTIKDDDMERPKSWRSDPMADYKIGHRPGGKTIALHAVAVLPAAQGLGLGKWIVKNYLERIQATSADRVSILAHEGLIPFYEKLGFKSLGRSECTYAGEEWYDLEYAVAR